RLESVGKFPPNMERVKQDTTILLLVGLEKYPAQFVPGFLAGKFEVTNEEFKKFVDAGGYIDPKYWDQPIVKDGTNMKWEDVAKLFVDKTGKPGPSTWELGSFPEGKEKHPVTGVSWYEAMAYAKFAGKSLPSLYHWAMLANTWNTWGIIPHSNFNGIGTLPVGQMQGTGYWGAHDIAGNAREWCYNKMANTGERYIMGGGYNDPTYA